MQVSDGFEIDKTFVDRMAGWQDDNGNGGNGADTNKAMPAPAPALHPATGETRLGSGIITCLIGRGGMAAVYKVWNGRLELFRAVKLLERAGFGARFETEAKITAKLRHPNIVEIYSVGEWNGLPYMEMEYVDGENLQQTLSKRGRFPEAVCCAAASCVAEALRHAHTLKFSLDGKSYCGIIHRDLKPANIMVSTQGAIKLTDFGIARPAQASLHTIEGNIAGTLHYLSPEQMEGKEIDSRSDIYSFGAILYEMATGVKTFPRQTIVGLMKQRSANSFKMPYEHGFPLSPALSNIIIRCLRYNPKKRYQDTASLLEDLHKAYRTLSGEEPQKLLQEYFSDAENFSDNHQKTVGNVKKKPANISLPAGKFLSLRKTFSIRKNLPAGKDLPAGKKPSIIRNTSIVKKPSAAKNSSAATILIIPLTALAVFSLSYIMVRFTNAHPRNPAISLNSLITSELKDNNLKDMPDEEAAPEPETSSPQTPEAAAAPARKPVSRPAPSPATNPAPAKPENERLREAATALNAKQWDAAIRILETEGPYMERPDVRTLLLLEAYVESKRFDDALTLMDAAAQTRDANYFLSAGKFWYYKGNNTYAMELLGASLTRPSVSKYKNVIFCDALYYIAEIKQERFRAAPSEQNRSSALDGWNKVLSACGSKPDSPKLEKAEKEVAHIIMD